MDKRALLCLGLFSYPELLAFTLYHIILFVQIIIVPVELILCKFHFCFCNVQVIRMNIIIIMLLSGVIYWK